MQEFGLVNSLSWFYIGFSSETNIFFLRFLKKGFRHCFIFFGDETKTVVIDPLSNRIDISFIPVNIKTMVKKFEMENIKVLFVKKNPKPEKSIKLGIFTCVEVVKRILGISKPFVITPFMLYKFLNKRIL